MIAMASFDFLRSSDKEQVDQRQICFCFPACQKIDPVSQATRRHTEDGTHWLQAISFTQHGWVGCFSLPNCIVVFIVSLHYAAFVYSSLLFLSQKWRFVSFRCVSSPSMWPHLWCFCVLGLILLVTFRQDGTSPIGQRPRNWHCLEQGFHSHLLREHQALLTLILSRFLRFIRGSQMFSWKMSSNFVISCKAFKPSKTVTMCDSGQFWAVHISSQQLPMPCSSCVFCCSHRQIEPMWMHAQSRHSSPPLSPGAEVPWGTPMPFMENLSTYVTLPTAHEFWRDCIEIHRDFEYFWIVFFGFFFRFDVNGRSVSVATLFKLARQLGPGCPGATATNSSPLESFCETRAKESEDIWHESETDPNIPFSNFSKKIWIAPGEGPQSIARCQGTILSRWSHGCFMIMGS